MYCLFQPPKLWYLNVILMRINPEFVLQYLRVFPYHDNMMKQVKAMFRAMEST